MSIVLITNDDGIHAPGIKTLHASISEIADAYVVAPDRERSASGHSLTIHKPVKAESISARAFSLNGTPTDCVLIGANKLLPEKPSLIVSGINNGPNLGDDITYSGTVAAAIEGTIMNIPSFAVSLNVAADGTPHYDTAARFASRVAGFILDNSLPYDTLLNINVPDMDIDSIAGVKITRQGKRVYDGSIHETSSPWGELYYWIGGGTPYWEHGEDTDISAVLEGFISITPLHLDLTNHEAIGLLRKQWK
jgi:5'-nucleotidase